MRARRRDLLLGALAAPAALPALASAARSGRPDGERLEELLNHERGLLAAYEAALERGVIERELGARLASHEREHVGGLEEALRGRGGEAAPGPAGLEAGLGGRQEFARFALELETRAIEAYEEALAGLDAERLLQPLGSILAAGAQHRVALRQALGEDLLDRENVQ